MDQQPEQISNSISFFSEMIRKSRKYTQIVTFSLPSFSVQTQIPNDLVLPGGKYAKMKISQV